MARVSDSDVKEIFSTSIDTTPFINATNTLVTAKLADANLGDSLMKEIEKYLAAHLASLRDPQAAQEKVGDASITYQGKTGMGLDSTPYGQTVKLLDTSGILANLGKRVAKISVIDES